MEILTLEDGQKWLERNHLPKNEKGFLDLYKNKIGFLLPKDSGIKTAIARSVIKSFKQSKEKGVFWITEWGVWQSSENQNLFYKLRKTLNEDRTILEAPFHAFNMSDLLDLECLLDLSLYFIWTTVLISPDRNTIIRSSHDEFIDVYCKDELELSQYNQLFGELELKRLK